MTIKSQGGIFGRNPTFNDVTVESDLSVDGTLTVGGSNALVATDIGSTVQAYDADTAKLDVAQTFTASQTFSLPIEVSYTNSSRSDLVTLKNLNTGGYGPWINLYGDYNGGYSFAKIGAENQGNGASLRFHTANTSGVSQERVLLDNAGNVSITNGNLVMATSGSGIDFSATAGTGTSELFDDYEEGTWTPAYGTSGTPFDAITHNTQDGYYRKVGSLVVVNFFLRTTSVTVGSGTGAIIVTGLPFAAISARNPGGAVVNTFGWGVNAPRNVRASGSTLLLSYHNAASRSADNTVSDISAAGNNDCYATCIYYT